MSDSEDYDQYDDFDQYDDVYVNDNNAKKNNGNKTKETTQKKPNNIYSQKHIRQIENRNSSNKPKNKK